MLHTLQTSIGSDMSEVLKQICHAIESNGQTRYAISKATGIPQSQLSRLMAGESGLSIDSLERLVNHLNLEIIIRRKRRKRGK